VVLALLTLLACGTERWTAKTLSDPAAVHLNLATKATTIAALNALPKGCAKGENERSGVELQLYRVTGRVKLVKREKDGDLHIVLADGKGRTMVVESPSSACARPSRFRSVIAAARSACALFKPGQVVTVEGPAFYDFFHGQTGMARSCVEIHPVMWVR
jgi:DNA/RNA endonuclease YhcR with UshA esterase domain